jgi:hypothetical protein
VSAPGSDASDDDSQRGSARLILDAYVRAARHRERVEVAPFVPDARLDEQVAAAEYFAAVMEYYNRLEPHLVDRPAYWERAPLWTDPDDGGDREQLVEHFARYYHVDYQTALDVLDAVEADNRFPCREQDETVRGLQTLQLWRRRSTVDVERERDPYRGVVEREVERPEFLPPRLTLRAHTLLDEAASDLGFGPEGDVPEEWDRDPL